MGAITAKNPNSFKEEAERLITLKEFKKTLPRKHGPQAGPVISEAMKIRDTEKSSYKDIYDQLVPTFGEQMRNLTPVSLSARVPIMTGRPKRLLEFSTLSIFSRISASFAESRME